MTSTQRNFAAIIVSHPFLSSHHSTPRTTPVQKFHSAITPTRLPRSASHSTIQPSDTMFAHSQKTVILPSPLSQVPSTSSVDPDSSTEQRNWSITFNNQVAKELDVEMIRRLSHERPISCVKFSRDGQYLAAGCLDGKVYIYSVETGTLTW
jgi:glucose repression regulatory protein TUP1